ncbi:hypothetical protein ACTA71_002737 [Dictyostelium dimigraforme]
MSVYTGDSSLLYLQYYEKLHASSIQKLPTNIVIDERKRKDGSPSGFTLYLIVEKKSWDKAIRINGAQYSYEVELKVGDNGGFLTLDSKSKCLYTNLNWNSKNANTTLSFASPKSFGVWSEDFKIDITPDQRKIFDGREIYVYWSDNEKFYKENIDNKIKRDQIGDGLRTF